MTCLGGPWRIVQKAWPREEYSQAKCIRYKQLRYASADTTQVLLRGKSHVYYIRSPWMNLVHILLMRCQDYQTANA